MIRITPHHLPLLQPVMDGLPVLILVLLSSCHPSPATAENQVTADNHIERRA